MELESLSSDAKSGYIVVDAPELPLLVRVVCAAGLEHGHRGKAIGVELKLT